MTRAGFFVCGVTMAERTKEKRNTANRPPNAGKGRPKGSPNKITRELKEMILGALDDAGGQQYLSRQAEENPNAFMQLVGKVLPMTVHGSGKDGALTVIVETGIQRDD